MASFGLYLVTLLALFHGTLVGQSVSTTTAAGPTETRPPSTQLPTTRVVVNTTPAATTLPPTTLPQTTPPRTLPPTLPPTTLPPTTLPLTTKPPTTTKAPPPAYGIVLPSYYDFYSDNLITYVPAVPEDLSNYTGPIPSMSFDAVEDVQFVSCAVDYRKKMFFGFDMVSRRILVGGELDTGLSDTSFNFSEVHLGAGQADARMAMDWVSGNIIWADNGRRHIAMAPAKALVSNGLYKIILDTHLKYPVGVTVDPEAGYIFVADALQDAIIRCTLTGQDPQHIITEDTRTPYDVTADLEEKMIYYIDNEKVWRADYNGGKRHQLVKSTRSYYIDFISVEVFRETVMVVEYYGGQLFLYNKTTGDELADPWGKDEYSDVCMFHEDAQPMKNNVSACETKGCQDLCVVEPPYFTGTCLCREGYDLNSDTMTCTEGAGTLSRALLFTDGNQICIIDIRVLADFHDSFFETMICFYSRTTGTSDPTQNENPILNMALKSDTRTVFFATKDEIYTVSMDEQNPTPSPVLSITGVIGGISYDWLEKNLYFTDTDAGTINIYSIEAKKMVTLTTDINEPDDIVVVPHYKKVYWTYKLNDTTGAVGMADLDLNQDSITVMREAVGPATLLNHDPEEKRILHHEEGSFYNYMRSTNYTGGNMYIAKYFLGDMTAYTVYKGFYAMATYDGEVAEIETGYKSSGYGPNKKTLDNMGEIISIIVQDVDLQAPGAAPCIVLNGGCEQFCLPAGKTERKCLCSKGFTLGADGTSCNSKLVLDDFLLVVDMTYDTILQIPLDGVTPVQGVHHGADGDITSVMYNYLTNTIVYTSYELWESNMNGTKHRTLMPGFVEGYGEPRPGRMALDSSTGNIFYTSSYQSVIGVVAPSGIHTILEIGLAMYSPRDIALDVERRYIFWVDMGHWSTGGSLNRCNMDGSEAKTLAGSSVFSVPVGIALDTINEIIYVTEASENKLYSCLYNGSNPVVLHEAPDSSIEDIVYDGKFLYITSWELEYITRLDITNINDVQHLWERLTLGRMNGMDIYRSSNTKIVKTECSTDNGGCTHFCFPTPTGHTCGCEYQFDLLADNKTCSNVPACNTSIPNVIFPDDCVAPEGESCTFKCAVNYKRGAGLTDTMNCLTNITWDHEEPCEEILCTDKVPNGLLDEECNVKVGSMCNVTCNMGYELLPDVTYVECDSEGNWDVNEATLCEEKCPVGLIKMGSLVLPCERKPGVQCIFQCVDHYKPRDDDAMVTCLRGSQWNRDPNSVCEEILCPVTIPHGSLSNTCVSVNVGSDCSTFTCNTGYELIPSGASLKCGTDGLWAGPVAPAAICEEKCPDGINSGSLVPCGRSPGDTCTFQCDYTHRPRDDNAEITCQSGSQWDRNPSSVCEEIFCPKKIAEATLEVNCSRKVGERCLYSCDEGYIINIDVIHQTCQRSGGWKNTGNPMDDLCVVPTTQPPADQGEINNLTVAFVVVVAVLVIGLLILAVYVFRLKGKSPGGRSDSYKFQNNAAGGTSYENPQYANAQPGGQATGGSTDRDLGYTKFENDHVEVTLEDKL